MNFNLDNHVLFIRFYEKYEISTLTFFNQKIILLGKSFEEIEENKYHTKTTGVVWVDNFYQPGATVKRYIFVPKK